MSIFNPNPPVRNQVSSFNMLCVSLFFFFSSSLFLESESLATSVPCLDPHRTC